MTQNDKAWDLPFEEYSLIYFAASTPTSELKKTLQVAHENPEDNFIVFGSKLPLSHEAPSNIHFAGLVESSCFLYALRGAKAYIGTLGLGPTTEAYRLNIPILGLTLHAEQRANIRFCPDAVILKSVLEYTTKKTTWVPDPNKTTTKAAQECDSALFEAQKIDTYLQSR